MFLTNRLFDLPIVQRNNALRTFLIAAWLGWQVESNWANPILFLLYAIARPLSGVLILVVMYTVITNGAIHEPIFGYIYLGNALYILVGQTISGVSWSVFDDRERYRMNKQLYSSPMSGYFYLLGRGVARLMMGSVSVLITVGVGIIAFNLPISLTGSNWLLFFVSTALGIISLASLGLIIGGISLRMARHFDSLGDVFAGAFYLFTGAIFPLDVLPEFLRPIGFALPVTYWLELARRALLGPTAAKFPTLAGYSDLQLLGILAVMTAILAIFSWFFYHWIFHQAKENGIIDMETSF